MLKISLFKVGQYGTRLDKILTLFVLVIFFFLAAFYILKSNFLSKRPSTTTNIEETKVLDKETLSGKILYQNGKQILSFNPKDNTSSVIAEINTPYSWAYRGGYVFTIDSEFGLSTKITKVNRISVFTGKKDTITIDYLSYLKSKSNKEINYDNYWITTDKLITSPDGNKVAVILSFGPDYGYPIIEEFPTNTLYLIEFDTNKITRLNENVGGPQWFADNRNLFIGDDKSSVMDTESGVIRQVSNLRSRTITPSREGNYFLWFDSKKVDNPTNTLREPGRPDMVLSSLSGRDFVTPFSTKFPVIARDFKKVTNVVPGYKENEFLVEIDNGKSDIYWTDGFPWGTFKKITPNTPCSYYLYDYSPATRKILALKRGSGCEPSLVLLDEGNYAETFAEIDQKNFFEKELVKLKNIGKLPPPFFYGGKYYTHSNIFSPLFSPDGKFVVASTEFSDKIIENVLRRSSKVKIISTEGKGELLIFETFGGEDKIYWIQW